MKQLYILILSVLLVGCYTQKKATRQVIKADTNYPEVLDGYCGQTRPPLDSTDTRVIYKEGETIHDTITDTRLEVINDTVYKTEYKTVIKTRRDTIVQTHYQREVNNSKLRLLEGNIKELSTTNTELQVRLEATKKSRNNWRLWFIVLAGYIVVKMVLRMWNNPIVSRVVKWLP